MKFLEHSQKEDPLSTSEGQVHDKDAADTALADADVEEHNMNAPPGDDNAIIEEPPSFFDELHARLAPSRSLKKHFLEDEVMER
jgi:hypothetical protein